MVLKGLIEVYSFLVDNMSYNLLNRLVFLSCLLITSFSMSLYPLKGSGLDRLSGEALKIKITEYLANKGMESYPAININKKFPPCESPLAIFPMFQGWSTVEVVCTESGNNWKVLVRTRAHSNDLKSNFPTIQKQGNLAIIATKSLTKGHLITEEDIQLVEVKKSIGTGTFRKKIDLIGRKLKNNVSVGFALRSRHLEPNWVIMEGDKIDIVQTGNMFNVSVIGMALQNGQEGEKIKVRNMSSEKVLVARVINEKKVSINANSLNN